MPVNFTQEYLAAERKYQEAKTLDEKITCLEEGDICTSRVDRDSSHFTYAM